MLSAKSTQIFGDLFDFSPRVCEKAKMEVTKARITSLDRRLIAELDTNCRRPAAELGRLLGKSRQTVEYRIRRLCDAGVITGFHSSVSPGALGYRL